MINKQSKKVATRKRHFRIRKKISGTSEMPRLSLYKSNRHMYAQLIDDSKACTLVSSSTVQPALKKEVKGTWTKEAAKKIGEYIAGEAISKGIKKIVFDRGGNKYHGKILAFAEGARSKGLEF